MKKIIIVLLLLSSFGFYRIALAQSGIYITSESGWATQSGLPAAGNAQAKSIEKSHFPVWRLGIGYLHDFNDKIGLGFEAAKGWYRGATYYLNAGGATDTYSTTLEFLAVIAWHQQPLDFFVKLGGIRHTLSGFSSLSGNSDASETKIQPEVTAGINYNLNEHFALTSEYLHSFGGNMSGFVGNQLQCPSINAVLVGIRIAFW
ncbi:MAG: hypothetical protein ACD_21C00199G0001 [uncultured bacterium]|nr:MAG: hypothetical protein ACD_21C00199G0001 [uncultured bacterium]